MINDDGFFSGLLFCGNRIDVIRDNGIMVEVASFDSPTKSR